MSKIISSIKFLIGKDSYKAIDKLNALLVLLRHNKRNVVYELKTFIQYYQIYNAPGKPSCFHCNGRGYGIDGKGDSFSCDECKPELKDFWEYK